MDQDRIGGKVNPLAKVWAKNALNLTQYEDELELYIAVEKRDFNHIAGLRHYTEQVTSSIVYSVCKKVKGCDLNP